MQNPNQRGDIAEAAIAYEAMRLGVEVFRPAADHSRCDMVFGTAGRLQRVQCKSARKDGEVVIINLVSSRYTPSGCVLTRYTADEVDLVAAHCHDLGRNYLFPFSLVDGMSSIQMRLSPPKNCQRAAIHYASGYEFPGAVAQLGERAAGSRQVVGSSPISSIPQGAEEATIGAHELRDRFGFWMERANAGDEIAITRHGRPFARLGPHQPKLSPG